MQLWGILSAFTESESAGMREAVACFAGIVTLAGVGFCWNASHSRMSIEERAKDGKLTEEEARLKIRIADWRGPVLTVVGVGLLVFALLG